MFRVSVVCTVFRIRTEIPREVVQKPALEVGESWVPWRMGENGPAFEGVFCSSGFGSSPLNKSKTLVKWQNIWKKIIVAVPKRGKLLQCVGPWLLIVGHCSLLDSTLRGRGRKAEQQESRAAGTVAKLQLNQRTTCARSSRPWTEQEIQDQFSLCSEWWRGGRTLTTRGRGRARDDHPVPTLRWAVRWVHGYLAAPRKPSN